MAAHSQDPPSNERRRWLRLSPTEREDILDEARRQAGDLCEKTNRESAEAARDLVLQSVKVEIGNVAIRVILFALGLAGLAALLWLFSKGKIGL